MKKEEKDQTELRGDELPFVHFLLYPTIFFNFMKLYIMLKYQLANSDLRKKGISYWTVQRKAKLLQTVSGKPSVF